MFCGDWRKPPHDANSTLLRPAYSSPVWQQLFGNGDDAATKHDVDEKASEKKQGNGAVSGKVYVFDEVALAVGREESAHAKLLAALRVGDRQAPVLHSLARASARGLHSVAVPEPTWTPHSPLETELSIAQQFGGVLLLQSQNAAATLNDHCLRSLQRFENMVLIELFGKK